LGNLLAGLAGREPLINLRPLEMLAGATPPYNFTFRNFGSGGALYTAVRDE
jgi:hypothetical protein